MKLFPKNDYSIELYKDYAQCFSELESKTLSKEQFVTSWKNQVFIGKVGTSEFEVQLSIAIFGAVCVFRGKLENDKGTLELRAGRLFKIIFIVMVLFVFSGIITALLQQKLEVLFPIVITIFIMRFVYLDLCFRIVAKIGIKKLTEIIGIKKIEKTL